MDWILNSLNFYPVLFNMNLELCNVVPTRKYSSFANLVIIDILFLLSHIRVAQQREDAVSKEVMRKLTEADNKKMPRKEKDERWVG